MGIGMGMGHMEVKTDSRSRIDVTSACSGESLDRTQDLGYKNGGNGETGEGGDGDEG